MIVDRPTDKNVKAYEKDVYNQIYKKYNDNFTDKDLKKYSNFKFQENIFDFNSSEIKDITNPVALI